MKNLVKGNLMKKIISIILILAIMIPYFPMSVFANDEETTENDNDYAGIIDLDVAWNNQELLNEGVLEGYATNTYSFKYTLKLNQIQTGFKNVRVFIETDQVDGVYDDVTSPNSTRGNGYAIVNYENQNTGVSLQEDVSVGFRNYSEKLDRKVTVKVTGTYKDPTFGDNIPFTVKKELKASITPYKTQNTPYNVNLAWSRGTWPKPSFSRDTVGLGNTEFGTSKGYYTRAINATYPLYIQSQYRTQELDLKITINRWTVKNAEKVNKLSEAYTINWDGLTDLLGTPTQTTNEDGSITYTFHKEDENKFAIDEEFNIKINYSTPNTNAELLGSEADSNTSFTFQAELNCTGESETREWGQEPVITEITKSLKIFDSEYSSLYQYTPGRHAWISITHDPYLVDKITSKTIEQLKTNRTITLGTNVGLSYTGGDKEINNGSLYFSAPTLRYLDDSGRTRTLTLDATQLKINTVNNRFNIGSKFVCGDENSNISGTYTVQNNTNSFNIEMPDFLNQLAPYVNSGLGGTKTLSGVFLLTYTLNADALGLTDTELENIQEISFGLNTNGDWIYGGGPATIKKEIITQEIDHSYMELYLENFDTEKSMQNKPEGKTLKLKMYKDADLFGPDTIEEKNYVVNKNPVFYVSLPPEFKYKNIDVNITNNNYISIDEDNMDLIKANGVQYLVIPCIGTYDSRNSDEIDITITYTRTLINGYNQACSVDAFMFTDNQNYFRKISNIHNFEKGEEIPNEVFYDGASFNVVGGSELSAITYITRGGRDFEPNPSNSIIEMGEKELPLLVDSNDKVTINSAIEASGDNLKNISIITRLPFKNNTFINDTSKQLIETDYELPDSFYNKYASNVKGNAQGEAVKQLDMTNIKVLGVYSKANELSSKVPSSNYKIYYSTNENADFETDMSEFTLYEEGTSDLSQAKTIKIVFNEDYTLNSGRVLYLSYEATMPDEEGMVGTVTTAQYTRTSNSQTETLHSPAAYMINGVTTSNIVIQKKFENYRVGYAPPGVSLEGIEFKLQYYDETAGQKKFLQNSNNEDIIATTNSSGIATFANIPAGDYYLYEVTEFDSYSGIGNINLISVEPSETVNYTATNYLKRGDIIINKKWEGTNENQGEVTFVISRVNAVNETLTFTQMSVKTENGVARVQNIPYGNYAITESVGKIGWTPSSTRVYANLNAEQVEKNFSNKAGKGILQIVKTVPVGQSVEELSFEITGRGVMTYNDEQGNPVNTGTSMVVKVSDEQQPENTTVTVSEDKTTATIKISNLYLGYYFVQEIDVPTIDANGTSIPKYSAASGEAVLEINDTFSPVVVSLTNNYKYGYIEINKKAKLKEGTNYSDIGDLSEFQVHVTGTSYYGNPVDSMIQLDENGHGIGRFEIGEYTLTEVPVDGYTTYYGTDSNASTDPVNVRVQLNRNTTQNLYNEHTGVGYVRVEKKLETVTDAEKVKNAGIKFAVVGQNAAGGRVNEIIEINQIDETKNVAYGISGPISVGGDYELQEIESTVPEFYEGVASESIEITTANTLAAPVLKTVTNARGRGDLEIVTTTNPEGGPLKGITYKVTEVELGENGTYTKIGTTKEVEGSNEDFNASFAELENIYSGYYLVEQDKIPAGWVKDVSQIVEVPVSNTGYANFEITAKKKLKENKVTINKVILNEAGEVATEEEIEAAKLDVNESFEMKITNVNTQEEYYVFTSAANPGVIQGLDAGTYKVEEITKPKYTTEGYYKTVEVENPVQGLEPLQAIEKINATEGSYLFEITESGNRVEDVTLTVKNKIDTSYGFAGQTHIDNLSKEHAEEETVTYVTKAVIYAVDENANAISGAKFKLLDSTGAEVTVNNGTEFEIANKKLIIKGLQVGTYTLKCTAVPEGYLVPEDETVIVYSDATQVARVEIQKNIPRGSLTLSTTYKTDKGTTKYLPRSKYKIVDVETGELVKFVRTATGDYKKSNLEDASPLIVLKAGTVEVEGIETGHYEVGIVDVTKGYGIEKLEVEDVTVEENVNKEVNVEVVNHSIVKVDAAQRSNIYLNENGELFFNGYDEQGIMGTGETYNYSTSSFVKLEFPVPNVKIKKYVYDYYGILAIDTEGRVWTWGYENYGRLFSGSSSSRSYTPVCRTESGVLGEAYYNDETKFVDVQADYGTALLLDNKGRVWSAGNYAGNGSSQNQIEPSIVTEFASKNITISKLGKIRYGNSTTTYGVIDTLGRVWTWGANGTLTGSAMGATRLSPICISEVIPNVNPTAPLEGVVIKDLLTTGNFAMAVDSDGNLWMWGTSGIVQETIANGVNIYPTKIDSSYFGGAKIKEIAGATNSSSANGTEIAAVIDEHGKVWTWGYGTNGELGNGGYESSQTPVCISDDETEMLYGVEMKDIEISDYNSGFHIIAVDTSNRLWAWGGKSEYGEVGAMSVTNISTPQNMTATYDEHFEYNLKFKEVVSNPYNNNKLAIDTEGRVWVWGQNNYNSLGINNRRNRIVAPTILDIPGSPKIKKVSSAEYNTLMVSEDGRVYIAGYGDIGDGTKIGGYTGIGITEITDNFNLPSNITIEDVHVFKGTSEVFAAIDSEGKVYTWGTSTSSLGRTNSSNALLIECISDDANEPLKGKKIKKISNYYSNALAIADDGTLYTWGSGSAPFVVETETKFVDVNQGILLDEDGKAWYFSSPKSVYCISDMTSYGLYKNYQVDPNYKIVKLYDYWYTGTYAIAKDSNGDWWLFNGYSPNKYDVPIKDVLSLSCKLLVDKYGQIWEMEDSGIKCLSDTVENKVYNVKMKKILSDYFVADEKGNLWYFDNETPNSAPVISGISPIEYLEGTLGVNVVDSYYDGNPSGTRGIFQVALDDNGKVWKGDSNEVVCLSDIGELAEEYENSDFRITNIYGYEGGNFIVLDNSGRVWQYVSNVSELKCLKDTSGNILTGITEIEIPTVNGRTNIIAKDNNGKVWMWGGNYGGAIGDGTTTASATPYCINTNALNGKSIKDIDVLSSGIILCEDDSVYVSGDNNLNQTYAWTYMGTCEGADKVFAIGAQDLVSGFVYVVSGENKVWCFGCNQNGNSSYGICGTGNTTDKYITTPTLISESFTIADVSGGVVQKGIYAIDTEGFAWRWGYQYDNRIMKINGSNKYLAFMQYVWLISTDGKVSWGSTEEDHSKIIKDLYGELSKENIIKYVKSVKEAKTITAYGNSTRNVIVNGKLWELTSSSSDVVYVNSYRCLNDMLGSEMVGKQIVDNSAYKALDSEGNLYVWNQNTGLGYNVLYPKNITKASSYSGDNPIKNNNTVVNIPVENNLYGVKVKELINDRFVIDENNDVWYFTVSGEPINVSKKHRGDSNPLNGKQIARTIGNSNSYAITTDNEVWYIGGEYPAYVRKEIEGDYESIIESASYAVALKDGKIWTCGTDSTGMGNGDYTTNDEPVCLNDIEGTELYNAHQADPNFRIVKLLNSKVAIDNSGKVWAWGRWKKAETESTYELYPVCFTDIENSDLYNAYYNDNIKIVGKASHYNESAVIDSTGVMWLYYNGAFKPYLDGGTPSTYNISDEEFKVASVPYSDGSYSMLLGTNGDLYTSIGNDSYKDYSFVKGNVTGVFLSYKYQSTYTSYYQYTNVFFAYGSDGVYKIQISYRYNRRTGEYYNRSVTTTKNSYAENIVSWVDLNSTDSKLVLDNNGNIKLAHSSISSGNVMTDIASLERIGNTVLITDNEGKLYACEGLSTATYSSAELFTKYDEIVQELYGEVTNETRKQLVSVLATAGVTKTSSLSKAIIRRNNKTYQLQIENSELTCKEINLTGEYINGIGNIQSVVGEYEVQTEDGKMYRLTPNGVDSYTLSEVSEATDFTTATPDEPVTLEGVNVVKQTAHKALDDQGNLYVWDEYTGLTTETQGTVNLTEREYDVEPVYLHSNGWSIIKSNF